MIELRWLVSPRNDVERQLQYRQNSEAFGLPIGMWTEWKDVPEVTGVLPDSPYAANEQEAK